MVGFVEEEVDLEGFVVDVEEGDFIERGGISRKIVESMLKMGRNLEMINFVKGVGRIYY